MMNSRTFAAVLAGMIMLISAVAGIWKQGMRERDIPAESEVEYVQPQIEEFIIPVQGEMSRAFGAEYSSTYGQWSMQTETVFSTQERADIYAPLSGRVERIEAEESGGSKIALKCGEATISLFPVYEVRVFVGSSVQQGERLGSVQRALHVQAERGGETIDPQSVTGEITFPQAAGEWGTDVE